MDQELKVYKISEIEKSQRKEYIFLGKLKQEIDYYLGWGNYNEDNLYYKDFEKQLSEMKNIYDNLVVKPRWITEENFENYENISRQICLNF